MGIEESSEVVRVEENVAAKDPRSVTPEDLDLAKETVAKVIEDAKVAVSKITVEEDIIVSSKADDHVSVSHMTAEGRVTVSHQDKPSKTKRKISTVISTEELFIRSDSDEDQQKSEDNKIVLKISDDDDKLLNDFDQ